MSTILEEIKVYCEVEDTDKYDNQILQLINQEIAYLSRNKIPVTRVNTTTESWPGIDEQDFYTVIDYIGLSVMRKFDRTMFTDASYTSNNWIDTRLTDLIYQLKCIYDITGGG